MQLCCPRCEELYTFRLSELSGRDAPTGCPGCGLDFRTRGAAPEGSEPVEQCWLCKNREFYIQKDFNRRLGVTIVVMSALIIFLVMLRTDHLIGIYCLLAIALVDWIVYQLLANATVCYLCQSIYRGLPLNREHRGFYLGNEEKYKQLRQQWLEEILEPGAENAAEDSADGRRRIGAPK